MRNELHRGQGNPELRTDGRLILKHGGKIEILGRGISFNVLIDSIVCFIVYIVSSLLPQTMLLLFPSAADSTLIDPDDKLLLSVPSLSPIKTLYLSFFSALPDVEHDNTTELTELCIVLWGFIGR